jgi:hypothetical protein
MTTGLYFGAFTMVYAAANTSNIRAITIKGRDFLTAGWFKTCLMGPNKPEPSAAAKLPPR